MEFLFRDLEQILAVVDDLARLHHGVARQDAHDRAGGDGFAAAAFTGDGQGLALVQVKGDIAHGAHRAIVGAE